MIFKNLFFLIEMVKAVGEEAASYGGENFVRGAGGGRRRMEGIGLYKWGK